MSPLILRETANLGWYFSAGQTAFQKSTFGLLLEKHDMYSHDSLGNRIPPRDSSTQYVPIRKTHSEPSYTPSDELLSRFASISRRLLRLQCADPLAVRALEQYFGDVGARLEFQQLSKIYALFPLTVPGQRYIRTLRNRSPQAAELLDFELISTEKILNDQVPNDIRTRRLSLVRDAADELYIRALRGWLATGKAKRLETVVWPVQNVSRVVDVHGAGPTRVSPGPIMYSSPYHENDTDDE